MKREGAQQEVSRAVNGKESCGQRGSESLHSPVPLSLSKGSARSLSPLFFGEL